MNLLVLPPGRRAHREDLVLFKNCVFKVSVDTKDWLKAAGVRAIKTMAQTFIATIGSTTMMGEVSWKMGASATVLSGVLSLATSVAGIPEVTPKS